MSLKAFLNRLSQAGLDVDVAGVLDALWLASCGRSLNLTAAATRKDLTITTPDRPNIQAWERPRPLSEVLTRSVLSGFDLAPATTAETPVYPRFAEDEPSPTRQRASAVTLPAPPVLSHRLPLMRALRPLALRRMSRRQFELDEQATVEMSARSTPDGQRRMIVPMLRPRREPWYEVDIVLEDDDGIEVWEDTLKELARVFENTGAFRQVRRWRLRLGSGGTTPTLENSLGGRVSPATMLGANVDRLVMFVSNGVSRRWSDGRYQDILRPWMRDNSVVLLQLMPRHRWDRTRMGAPHGVVVSREAGAAASALHAELNWWSVDEFAHQNSLALPVIGLDAASVAEWARMQMARGASSPMYLICPPNALVPHKHADGAYGDAVAHGRDPDRSSIERAVSLLMYESPAAFRLGGYLAASPFTIPVARMVQTILFRDANTDTDAHTHAPSLLSDLLNSGVVERAAAVAEQNKMTRFNIRAEARPLMQRSLKVSEVDVVARELRAQLSDLLKRWAGWSNRESQLVPDERGKHTIPVWARPFADIADALSRSRATTHTAGRLFKDTLHALSPEVLANLLEMVLRKQPVERTMFSAPDWRSMVAQGWIVQDWRGVWRIDQDVALRLSAHAHSRRISTAEFDRLQMARSLLQSMALVFHVGGLTKARSRPSEELADWSDAVSSALAHCQHMMEYVFDGPVSEVLLSGVDPVLAIDAYAARATYAAHLENLKTWIEEHAGGRAQKSSTESILLPSSLRSLQSILQIVRERESLRLAQLLPAKDFNFFLSTAAKDWEMSERQLTSLTDVLLPRLIAWLENPAVADLLLPYCTPFFAHFETHGFSELALQPDYSTYLERLVYVWRRASAEMFKRARVRGQISLRYPVPDHFLYLANAQFPKAGIRAANEASRSNPVEPQRYWTISSPASYLALIDELAPLVIEAVKRRLAEPRRRVLVLWVDDVPGNNVSEREYFHDRMGVNFVLARSTDEALEKIRYSYFDLIISDMGRPPDGRAGYTLLDALRRRGDHIHFIVYARGQNKQTRDEARKHGALGSISSSHDLEGLLVQGLLTGDDFLSEPIDIQSLRRYTKWRYADLEVDVRDIERIVAALDRNRFFSLKDIDAAVTSARDTVERLVNSEFKVPINATDRLALSLSVADPQFLEKHLYWTRHRNELSRFAGIVRKEGGWAPSA